MVGSYVSDSVRQLGPKNCLFVELKAFEKKGTGNEKYCIKVHVFWYVNPLTSELNPSTQRCLPRFFTGILIFKGLTARRLYKSFGVKGLILK
jgi:hypothetical protein